MKQLLPHTSDVQRLGIRRSWRLKWRHPQVSSTSLEAYRLCRVLQSDVEQRVCPSLLSNLSLFFLFYKHCRVFCVQHIRTAVANFPSHSETIGLHNQTGTQTSNFRSTECSFESKKQPEVLQDDCLSATERLQNRTEDWNTKIQQQKLSNLERKKQFIYFASEKMYIFKWINHCIDSVIGISLSL